MRTTEQVIARAHAQGYDIGAEDAEHLVREIGYLRTLLDAQQDQKPGTTLFLIQFVHTDGSGVNARIAGPGEWDREEMAEVVKAGLLGALGWVADFDGGEE